MRDVSSEPTALARLMRQRGMSPSGLRHRIGEVTNHVLTPDPSLVWRWMNGKTEPSRKYITAIARALGVNPDELKEYDHAQEVGSNASASSGSASALVGTLIIGDAKPDEAADHPDVTWRGELKGAHEMFSRRKLLEASLIAAAASPVGRLYDSLRRQRLSQGALDGLSLMTNHLGRSIDKYDFSELDLQIGQQLSFVERYLRESLSVQQRKELCLNGARLSALGGFVAFLTGRIDRSLLCYDNAFSLAEEVQDRGLMAWVVAEEASMACYAGRFELAARMTRRALAPNSPNQMANISSNAARALSRMGSRVEAIEAIDATEHWSGRITAEVDSSRSGPMWSFSQVSAHTRVSESWLNLDEPRKAMDAAQIAIEDVADRKSPRFSAHAHLVLASAHARVGDVDQACSMASRVFEWYPQDFHTISARAGGLFEALPLAESCQPVQQLRDEFDFYMEASRRHADPALPSDEAS
jgi:tetratricopeptide (TPR) repeat protein